MRPLLLTSLLAIASIAALPAATASAAPPGETARGSACSTVSYDGRTYVMYRQGIGCRSARRKVRYVHRNKELPGWRCQSGTNFRTGGGCSRGRKLFGWHPAD